MNIKLKKSQHDSLCSLKFNEYVFGSQLHGLATSTSDTDIIRVLEEDIIFQRGSSKGVFLPNIHTLQYDDVENNHQYIWMTTRQFYENLFSGDGHIISDVVLLSGKFDNAMFLCRTYKNIKGYLGLVKRDLRYFDKNVSKQRHCIRGLYIAECLIENRLPSLNAIKTLKTISRADITVKLELLRLISNSMYEKGELTLYPTFSEQDELVSLIVGANNIAEFTYQ